MSDLVVTYANLQAPADSCSQDPPAATTQNPSPADTCHMVVPLVDEDEKNGKVHAVRFDRKASTFVLSQQNDSQDLTWVGNRGGLSKVIDMVRMTETVNRSLGIKLGSETFGILLTLTQYIVTGRIRFPSGLEYNPEIKGGAGNELQMASYLLEVFANNSDKALQRLVGALTIFRGETGVAKDVSDRISWVSDVLALRPAYLKFRSQFIGDIKLNEVFKDLKPEKQKKMTNLLRFSRQTVILNGRKESFRYDQAFLDAFLGFSDLATADSIKEKGDFCARLASARKELGNSESSDFAGECRRAAKYVQMSAEAAVLQSLRDVFVSPDGRKFLQSLVKSESDLANMTIEKLYSAGRLPEVLDVVLKNIAVKIPDVKGAQPSISLDVKGMKIGLNLLIGKNLVTQREYILAAVAVLRRFIDEKGKPLAVSVFHEGRWIDAKSDLTNGKLSDFQSMQAEMERTLNVSFKRTERVLPKIELSLCAAGLAGVAVNEIWEPFGTGAGDITMGVTSYGVAGGGCSALVGHYTWNKTTGGKVRNRYLWEGLTGLGGAAVGIGIYFLLRSFKGDRGDPTKFPVDEYGP